MPTKIKGHTYTNARLGQYLTHAHNHITRAMTTTDGCFSLIEAHQHDKAVGLMNGEYPCLTHSLRPRRVQSSLWGTSSTQHLWECWLRNAQQFYYGMRRALQAASAYKRREFWREAHTPLWLLIGRVIFLTSEETSFDILIGRIILFHAWKTSFAPLIGWNSFAYENLRPDWFTT